MNIILQNYNNLINNLIKEYFSNKIEKIIRSFNNYDIHIYISLLSSFDDNMNSFICHSIKCILEEIDRCYCNSLERKRKYHIKYKTKRTILTIFGEITYYRFFYKSKLNGSCFCYVDRFLGLKKYDYFDPYIKAEILDYVSENNYSKTAYHINSLIGNRICISNKTSFISRQTVRNIILHSTLSKPKVKRLKPVDSLYIISDEKWIPTQNNKRKKVMQKSIVIFDGFLSYGKRKKLNHKMTFSGRDEQFIYDAIDYIEEAYDTSKIKYIYMLGDGASWIKNLKSYFNYNPNITIIQGLDKFHFKQCLWKIYPDKDIYNALSEYVVTNNKNDFNRLTNEISDLYPSRKDKIDEYKKYIQNNWTNILNLYKYDLSCPMESQISHTFAEYFTSRPKAFNKTTINKLIKIRLLKKNNYNIKKLYLNNIDSKEEVDLNRKNLDFSIFYKKDTYEIQIETKRKHFLGI
ncbi:MAG: UPF0236 family protein [Bacilli bacterium]|nr:UPF0236 family protein [Bacilli bacterium]